MVFECDYCKKPMQARPTFLFCSSCGKGRPYDEVKDMIAPYSAYAQKGTITDAQIKQIEDKFGADTRIPVVDYDGQVYHSVQILGRDIHLGYTYLLKHQHRFYFKIADVLVPKY